MRAALEAEVPVLAVCLGAQLLAAAAGGRSRPGSGPQIGWDEVRATSAAHADPLFAGIPEHLPVLHWHGDTMDLPAGATLLASCDRYPVQAFRVGGSAWGLQFHLEVDKAAVDAFAAAFPGEAAPGRTRLLPVTWDGATARPVGGHRPAFLHGAALADALAAIPPHWSAGDPVPLILLS
ncbi:gamma-glutamyl-gamma-aminobutyrate hydrolase family protein [Streptomyces canus]|uniref:type 1 glutamine amidotransferase n=1 Tax=Streptomyces canus TaxID=58343 RepID=UPI0030E0D0D7